MPLIINKAITVTGGQLTVNHAGIILGDNVTFQDMKLKLTNFVRNGILANGYTLKMSNVENVSQGVSIHLFAGGLSDILDTNSWKSSVPQTGSEGRIELDYKVNVGDIHGGGLSDISNSTLTDEVGDNTFDKPATIVFGTNLSSDSTLGTVYGGGAREVRGNQDQTADGNSLVHDFNLYQATGGVDIVVHNAISKIKIDGDTGPGQTQATVTYDATSQIPAALGDIQNISKLHVKQGNFNFKSTASTPNFYNTTVQVDDGQTLQLHDWKNATAPRFSLFHGGSESNPAKLTLAANQALTIQGVASGVTQVGIDGFNASSGVSWGVAATNYPYISAALSSNATFHLAPNDSQSGKDFVRKESDNGTQVMWGLFSQSDLIDISDAEIRIVDDPATLICIPDRQVRPEIEVWLNGIKLDPDSDYDVYYSENNSAGHDAGLVQIFGMNQYYGEAYTYFDILPAKMTDPAYLNSSAIISTSGGAQSLALPQLPLNKHLVYDNQPQYISGTITLTDLSISEVSQGIGLPPISYLNFTASASAAGEASIITVPVVHDQNQLGITYYEPYTLTVTVRSLGAGQTVLSIDGVTLAPKTYDNTNTATVQSVTFSGLQGDSLVKDIDYTASAYFTDINAGTNKTANVTVSLLDTAKTKYVLPNGTFTLSGQTISKANQQTPSSVSGSYAVSTTNASKFTYTATLISGAEYKMDAAGQWQNSNVFDNIEPLSSHTFYARMKATTNYNESPDANTGVVIFNKLPNSTKPALQVTLSGDSSNRTVTIAPVTGAEYSFDGGRNYSESNSQSGLRGQVNVAIRYKETATLNASEATSEVVDTDKQMQAALSIDPIGNKTYGDPSFTLSARGGSTASDVTFASTDPTIIRIDGATATILKTGTVTITATKAGDASYNPVSATVDITVNKAALTVKANDQQITMGASIPVLTFTATGLVNGDTFTAPDYDISSVNVNVVGQYPIAISGGILSNADCYTVTYQPGTLTVAAAGAGGGGGGGGGAAAGGTTDGTTQNADGSTTTTVTDKTTGTVTETTKRTDGSQTVVETKTDGSVTTTETAANGVTGVTATDKNGAVTSAEASVPAAVATQAAQNGQTVTLPVSVPTARTTETAPAVKIAIAGDAGAVKVEIPVAASKPGVVAVIVKADGTEEIVKTSVPTEGGVALTVEGAATVKIIDNSKSFDDVQPNDWYSGVVDFVSARSIFNGTSATTFEPDSSMTRGMLTVVLHNLENNPKNTTLTSDFADVGDDWYADAVRWATDNGIVSGYGDGLFGPDDSITREQLTVMLWRYAGSPVSEYSIAQFSDADQIDPYAQAALAWASENHIINGYSDGRLNPKGEATRAHVAQMLQNFLENT